MYHQPNFSVEDGAEVNTDVVHQLNFLNRQLESGAGEEMQTMYPEGYFFMNVLTGLSWCEVAKVADRHSTLFGTSLARASYCYSEINSDEGKRVFDKNLTPSYGIFYAGWENYLLGKIISVQGRSSANSSDTIIYDNNCEEIIKALNYSQSPYLESLQQSCWPSDVTVAVASLQFTVGELKPKADSCMRNWVAKVKLHLDTNGLMPHSAEYFSGLPHENARGSSQGLILNFLFEIDSFFARQQFKIYKEKFLTTRFGLPGICEYPEGESGTGDIDSGPVIFGIGGAASLVGLRAMTVFGEDKTAIGLRNSIEAFGFASTSGKEKRFLFGKLPIADAFIAWANSAEMSKSKALSTNENWRWRFQLYSFLILVLMTFIFFKIWKLRWMDWLKKRKIHN
jgi:hypothetical protein